MDRYYGAQISAGFGKFGPGYTSLSVTRPKEGIIQPIPGETTTDSRGVQGGTKTTGITSGIFVKTGISHVVEQISWPTVQSDQRDNTGGTSLANTVQCVSINRGTALDVTQSGR